MITINVPKTHKALTSFKFGRNAWVRMGDNLYIEAPRLKELFKTMNQTKIKELKREDTEQETIFYFNYPKGFIKFYKVMTEGSGFIEYPKTPCVRVYNSNTRKFEDGDNTPRKIRETVTFFDFSEVVK